MSRYVSLLNWTDQGVQRSKETVDRAEAAKDLAEKMGGSLESIYWTLGAYDLVVTSEFADDESATAFALALCSQGNVRSTTMRAFNADETRGILDKVG